MENIKSGKIIKPSKANGFFGKLFGMIVESVPRVDSQAQMNKLFVRKAELNDSENV